MVFDYTEKELCSVCERHVPLKFTCQDCESTRGKYAYLHDKEIMKEMKKYMPEKGLSKKEKKRRRKLLKDLVETNIVKNMSQNTFMKYYSRFREGEYIERIPKFYFHKKIVDAVLSAYMDQPNFDEKAMERHRARTNQD